MLKAAGLDWTTEVIPTYYTYNKKRQPTGDAALIRSSDGLLLDTVTEDWKPVQNADAADFFQSYIDEASATMHTAGSINDGQKVWFLAKLKQDQFSLFKGKDVVEPFLLFTNPNIYGVSTSVSLTPVRVVCNNTLTLSLSGHKNSDKIIRVSHRREFIAEDVKKTLGLVTKKMTQYKEAMSFLASKKISPEQLTEYLKVVFPVITTKTDSKKDMSKTAQVALAAVEQQPGAEFGRGTYYPAYQAVTFTLDHLSGRTDDARLNSAWYGDARTRKTKALETALEMANAA
jgi:phage/plasmid-like protein (TIGR03299 family)